MINQYFINSIANLALNREIFNNDISSKLNNFFQLQKVTKQTVHDAIMAPKSNAVAADGLSAKLVQLCM